MTLIGLNLPTFHASPEREDKEAVRDIAEQLQEEPLIKALEVNPMAAMIINKHRQILFSNKTFCALSLKEDCADILGLRPGEALECVFSAKVKAGCGCSEYCTVCGAANAIVKSLEGTADCQECRLLRYEDGVETPLDIQVFTQPFEYRGHALSIVFAVDISHEKRLKYLNRVFHHSLVSGVGGIKVLTELIEAEQEDSSLFDVLIDSSRRTLRDVLYHRDIEAAESGRLSIDLESFPARKFFDKLIQEECKLRNTQHSCAQLNSTCGSLTSDKRILGHVVRNMLANALEAREDAPGTITFTCQTLADGRTVLSMTNPGGIPADIQKQMFKRYVSTKSRDRGLGTYVMKLFTEQYLGGQVKFESSGATTTFQVILPVVQ